jgi:hypothetical protein
MSATLEDGPAAAPSAAPTAVLEQMAIRLLILFLVLAFGALTIDAFVEEGVTLPGVVSVLVLALLGIGVLGALFGKPPRGPRP